MGNSKTALVLVASGSEDVEFITIVDVLRRGGVEVTTASVEETEKVQLAWRNVYIADAKFEDVKDKEFDVIVIPGGMKGSTTIGKCEKVVHKIKEQKEKNKLYAAICAAPKVTLDDNHLLDGIDSAAVYPGFDLTCGNHDGRVCVSKNCVTSVGPGSAMEFALKLVELLVSKERAHTLAKALVLHPSVTF